MTASIEYHYTGPVFDPAQLARIVTLTTGLCRDLDFDSFVFMGTSGLIVGVPVALALEKPWGFIVKPGSHAFRNGYRGLHEPGRYVIIDDLVDSGRTVRAIMADPMLVSRGGTCVGLVLYNQHPDSIVSEMFSGTIPAIRGL